MRRTKEDAAATREQLLTAALAVFSRQGYAATTLDDVAKEAKVTRGAIYWHFGGKAELFNTLIRERTSKADAAFEEVMARGGAPFELLRRLLIRSLEYLEEDEAYRAVLELKQFRAEATPELAGGLEESRQATRCYRDAVADVIRRAQVAGAVRSGIDPDSAAIAAVGLVYGVTSLWLSDPAAFSVKARAAEVVEVFVAGLAT